MPNEDGAVVNTEAVQEAAAAEATTAEMENSEADNSQQKAIQADDGSIVYVDDTVENSDDNSESDDESKGDQPKRGAEARKGQLIDQIDRENAEIRDLVAKKNRMKAEKEQLLSDVEQENAQAYQPPQLRKVPTVEILTQQENPETGDFYTQFEAKQIIQNIRLQNQLEQSDYQRQLNEHNLKVTESVFQFSNDIQDILRDFPIFDPESSEYDPELDKKAERQLHSSLLYDKKTKRIVGSNMPSVYEYYETLAVAAGAKKRSQKQQTIPTQSTTKAHLEANADVRGSGQHIQKTFDSMSTKEMADYLRRKGHDV